MAEESFEERTEAPSQKRRQEAREKGNVVKSMEVNSVIVLFAAILGFKFAGAWMFSRMGTITLNSIGMIRDHSLTQASCMKLFHESFLDFIIISIPVVLSVLVMGVVANIIQVGVLFTGHPLIPKFEKVNPIAGLKRMFSMRSVVEAVKSCLKMIIVGIVVYVTVQQKYTEMLGLGTTGVGVLWTYIVQICSSILYRCVLVLLVLAILDYAYQRWEYERKLRMTKQELKEERKQLEGDPLVKSRIRSLQREMARRRMMQEVPRATVVVTNPTHLAIALRYEPDESDAPVVLAKGKNLVAEQIKTIAKEHKVPVIEDKPLARAMYDRITVGEKIPVEFFNAVAEILAYIYTLKNKSAA